MDRQLQDQRFGEWVAQHLGMMQRMARAFAAPPDQADLLQDILLAVWKAAPAWRGEALAGTFIYRIAFNTAAGWRRKAFRQARLPENLVLLTAEDPADEDRLNRLYAGLRALGEADRALVMLSLDGLGYREISAIHGLTETNVGARLSRARAKLSKLVMEKNDE